jgi:hypothetical protein
VVAGWPAPRAGRESEPIEIGAFGSERQSNLPEIQPLSSERQSKLPELVPFPAGFDPKLRRIEALASEGSGSPVRAGWIAATSDLRASI